MHYLFTRLVIVVIAFATSGSALADSAADSKLLNEEMARVLKENHFSGSVMVTKDAHVILDQGFGLANEAWQTPNSSNTKFRIGSLTKQFTAAAILLLEERGMLSLDDPIRKHWPELPVAWNEITLFHLLTHTSGIVSFTGLPAYSSIKAETVTPGQIVDLVRDLALEFKPGEQFHYGDTGYIILGRIIELLSAQPFQEFLHANIFKPLEMKNSGYNFNDDKLSEAAVGYSITLGWLAPAAYLDSSVPFSAGALYSTTRDLNRWQQALFGGYILSSASLEKMTTLYQANYGLGVNVFADTATKTISHGGTIDGFRAVMKFKMPGNIGIIVLSNREDAAVDNIATQLESIANGPPSFASIPIYLRGTMNQWGLSHRFSPVGPDLFAVQVTMPAGTNELKVASEDFSTLNFGVSSRRRSLNTQRNYRLEPHGPNLVLNINHTGTYNLKLNVVKPFAPRLSVSLLN